MSNMSYCRFQNTLGDLQDCWDALQEAVEEGSTEKLSDEERIARDRMVELCADIANGAPDLIKEHDENIAADTAEVDEPFDDDDADEVLGVSRELL